MNDWRDQAAALLAAYVRSRNAVRQYSTFDFGREQDAACVSIVVPEKKAERIVLPLRKQLPPGLVAFVGTIRWLGTERHCDDAAEVVIGPGASQFDIVRLARTDAVNHDLDTESIIAKLQTYDAERGIDIRHANTDSIIFAIRRSHDLRAFAEDLYAFCPDIVEQGIGSVDKLAERIDILGMVDLWWD